MTTTPNKRTWSGSAWKRERDGARGAAEFIAMQLICEIRYVQRRQVSMVCYFNKLTYNFCEAITSPEVEVYCANGSALFPPQLLLLVATEAYKKDPIELA